MDDQVTQNRRLEADAQLRVWQDLSMREKSAALMGLAEYLLHRRDLVNGLEARGNAIGAARSLTDRVNDPSPVDWKRLSDGERAHRLREVAAWTRTNEAHGNIGAQYLRDNCLDLADQLDRNRRPGRDVRER